MGRFKPDIDKMENKKNAKGLIKALKHKESWIRIAAVNALGRIEDLRAVEPLIQALEVADSSYFRAATVSALGKLGDARAVPSLIQALQDEGNVIVKAATALGQIGKPAVESLIQAMEEVDSSFGRGHAAKTLGRIGDAKAVDPLLHVFTNDKNNYVRGEAARALGEIGNTKAFAPLLQALNDTDDEIRVAAARALGEMGDARAVTPLLRALNDKDNKIRIAAAVALGDIGDGRAVESLIQLLGHYKLGEPAAMALGKIGEPAVGPLIQVIKHDKRIGPLNHASLALRRIRDVKAVEPLVQALQDYNDKVRKAAAEALGKIKRSESG